MKSEGRGWQGGASRVPDHAARGPPYSRRAWTASTWRVQARAARRGAPWRREARAAPRHLG
eukprot:scaffold111188_cov62-Phaeocystis_antarctica.AAC.1